MIIPNNKSSPNNRAKYDIVHIRYLKNYDPIQAFCKGIIRFILILNKIL